VLEIVSKLIEMLDSFEIEWEDLKRDTLRELKNNSTADNQDLWVCIREMAILMEEYVG
jgi:hypothetical protein